MNTPDRQLPLRSDLQPYRHPRSAYPGGLVLHRCRICCSWPGCLKHQPPVPWVLATHNKEARIITRASPSFLP